MRNPSPSVDLLSEHSDFVRGLARSLMGPDPEAEDVAQDAMTAALERGPRSPGAARSWFGRVVRNRIVSRRRRDGARRRWLGHQRPLRAAPDVSEVLAREETRRRVVAALLALPDIYREPLLLRFYEDLPPREIAARLEIPVETVRTRIRRGLVRMRAALDQEFGDRRAWQAALVGVLRPEGLRASVLAWGAVGVALCFAIALLTWSFRERDRDVEDRGPLLLVEHAGEDPGPALAGRDAAPAPAVREPAPPARRWRLRGRVHWVERKGPAPGIVVEAWRVTGSALRERLGRATSDEEGLYAIPLDGLADLGSGEIATSELFLRVEGHRLGGTWPPGVAVALPVIGKEAPELVLERDLRVHHPEAGGGSVFGRLVDGEGRPIQAADIRLLRKGGAGERVAKHGVITRAGDFEIPAGSTMGAAGKGIVEPETLDLAITAGQRGALLLRDLRVDPKRDLYLGALRLEPPKHVIRLRVTLADGTPAPYALLCAHPGTWAQLAGKLPGYAVTMGDTDGTVMTRTDAAGHCLVRVPRAGPWCVWVRTLRTGRQRVSTAPAPDLEIETGAPLTTVALDTSMLRIAFLDADGEPVAGASWWLAGWEPQQRHNADRAWREAHGQPVERLGGEAQEEARATARFEPLWAHQTGLPAFSHVTLLAPPGTAWIGRVDTHGGQTGLARFVSPAQPSLEPVPLRLRRQEPATLRFSAYAEGRPVEAFFAYQGGRSDGRTLPSGAFRTSHEFEHLAPGTYWFSFYSSDHVILRKRLSVTLAEGETKEVRLPVLPGGRIDVRLHATAWASKRAARAQLWMSHQEGKPTFRWFDVHRDAEGRPFAYLGSGDRKTSPGTRYRPGRVKVWITTEGYTCEPVEVDVRANRTTPVDLVLMRD